MGALNPVRKFLSLFVTVITFMLTSALSVQAALIPAEIEINSKLTFDSSASYGQTSGDITLIDTGIEALLQYEDTSATGTNPLTGSHTSTGDGIGFTGSVKTVDDEFLIGIDGMMTLTNTSLADTFELVFELIFSNSVDSSGEDAFSDSEFVISSGGSELFFTDLVSDTVNGNSEDGESTPDLGGHLFASGSRLFTFTLNPSEILVLDFGLTIAGGAYSDDGAAAASFSQSFLLQSVQNTDSGPQPVPEPSAILLMLAGLVGIVRKTIKK